MDQRSTILSELQTISSLVAGIQPLNPYSVPEGYFQRLPETVVELCRPQYNPIPQTDQPFQLPQGYFESFPSKLMEKIKASQNIDSSSEESEILAKIPKTMPYAVPAGYFEGFSQSILQQGEKVEMGAELNGLRHLNAYQVPTGYFESFPDSILAKVTRRTAKVVSMARPRRIFRMAAAAVVTGLLLMAGILYFNRPAPTTEVANIDQVPVDELENYLDAQTTAVYDNADISSSEIDGDDVRAIIADLPDAALQQYLIQYTDVKLETVN